MTESAVAPRILQIGTYSSRNKGDAAMELSTAAAIRTRWPDAEITISAPFAEDDARFYENVARVVPCSRRRLVLATLQVLRVALWRSIRSAFGADAAWLIPDRELRACRRADIVIDLSGDMLTDDYGPHVAYSHYIPIINALLLGRPVVICAQSIGPFRWTGWMARQLFERAAAITLRDEISIGHLRAIGLDPGKAAVTADMAFLLQPASDTRAAEILRSEGIADDGDGSVLGVSVSRILERRYDLSRPRGASDFATLMAETLDRFASQTGCRVVFVSHVTGPAAVKDDRLIARDVAARMSAPCHVIQGDYRPEELKALIRRCRVFLGARMHANIAALSSGVPVVALAYSHKTPGIMALFGQGERVLNGAELSAGGLFGQLSTAWATAPAIRERIESALPSVTAAALSNVGVIARLNGSREPLTA